MVKWGRDESEVIQLRLHKGVTGFKVKPQRSRAEVKVTRCSKSSAAAVVPSLFVQITSRVL